MKRKPASVNDDLAKTYFTLRLALGGLALALPLALFLVGGWLQGIRLQPSISAYYHSDARDVFVGGLCAIGLGLIAYKGFSRREDWALNIGGVLACCIALFPMQPQDALPCVLAGLPEGYLDISARYDRTAALPLTLKLHFPAAISFYLVLGFVMTFCSHHTLHLVPPRQRRRYLAVYPALGVAFVASMVWAHLLLNYFAPDDSCLDRTVFWVEVAGIVCFAAFWFIKTLECKRYGTDKRIKHRHQPRQVAPASVDVPAPPAKSAPSQAPQARGAPPPVPTSPHVQSTAAPWDDYMALWRLDTPAE